MVCAGQVAYLQVLSRFNERRLGAAPTLVLLFLKPKILRGCSINISLPIHIPETTRIVNYLLVIQNGRIDLEIQLTTQTVPVRTRWKICLLATNLAAYPLVTLAGQLLHR